MQHKMSFMFEKNNYIFSFEQHLAHLEIIHISSDNIKPDYTALLLFSKR